MVRELSSEFNPEGRNRMLLVEAAWWSVLRRMRVATHLHMSSMVPDSHGLHLPSLETCQRCLPDTSQCCVTTIPQILAKLHRDESPSQMFYLVVDKTQNCSHQYVEVWVVSGMSRDKGKIAGCYNLTVKCLSQAHRLMRYSWSLANATTLESCGSFRRWSLAGRSRSIGYGPQDLEPIVTYSCLSACLLS